jgi:tetratricopeptide (TPR) repeat protein
MKKSLVPLIVFLFCIVLLTSVIVNMRPEMRNPVIRTDSKSKKPRAIYLSSIETAKNPELRRRQQHIMDEKKVLNLLLQAYSELDKGKLETAEEKVKTVLVFQSENTEALSLLGKIYYLKHEYKEAEMIFTKQIKLNKKSASAYNNLGQVLLKQKKYTRAALQFQVAQGLDPESGLIALNLAGAYSQQGKKKESLAAFKKASELLETRIITVANHPALDSIRNEKEFSDILKNAYKELSIKQKKESAK